MNVPEKRRLEISGLEILIRCAEEKRDCLFVTEFQCQTLVWDSQFIYQHWKNARFFYKIEQIQQILDDAIFDDMVLKMDEEEY